MIMKRNIIAAILLMAAVAYSCTTKEESSKSLINDGSVVYNPTATIADFILAGTTKTVLAINEETGATFTFVDGDELGVFPYNPEQGDQVRFTVSAQDASSCTFNGHGYGLKASQYYAAYYPADLANADAASVTQIPVDYTGQKQTSIDGVTFDISAADYLVANGITPANNTCAFQMNHVGALLVMDVTFPDAAGTYTALNLSANAGVFVQTGTLDLTQESITVTPEQTGSTVSLQLGETAALAVDAAQTVRFCMMIAPADMSNATLTVDVPDVAGESHTATIPGKNFQAGYAYKLACTLGAATPDEPAEPTNLSEKETANTYIVDVDNINEAGYYFDATVAGNGQEVSLGLNAAMVWPENGSKDLVGGCHALIKMNQNNCISDVEYDATNNTIKFKATGAKGNARITLLNNTEDDNDYYLWNWTIWCTDMPGTVTFTTPTTGLSCTIMDRNLGAITNGKDLTNPENMYGLYFMQGDPLGYTVSQWESASRDGYRMQDEIVRSPIKPYCDRASAGDYYWFNPYSSSSSNGLFGILWGGGSNNTGDLKAGNTSIKTMYDPCPVGYKVMAYDTFYNINTTSWFASADSDGVYLEGTDGQVFIPFNGNVWQGGYTWMAPGTFVYLWTSGHNGRNMGWCHILDVKNGDSGVATGLQAHILTRGMGVRCVAE